MQNLSSAAVVIDALRVNVFIDAHTVLEEKQTSFRVGYPTIEHILVMHALTKNAKYSEKEIALFIKWFRQSS